MGNEMRSEDAVRAFADYQRALCRAFRDSYPVGDHDFLTDAPKHGAVTALDKYWEFTRHGKGLRFEAVPSGVVVDVTEGVFSDSEFFDAWRLGEYLESLSVESLTFEGERFDAETAREIERLLELMISRNLLSKHPDGRELVCCTA
jgi:hypothetical protein